MTKAFNVAATLAALVSLSGCMPRPRASKLNTIVGKDERNVDVALGLVPVQNYTETPLHPNASTSQAVYQAEIMIRTHLFALTECEAEQDPSGKTKSPGEVLEDLKEKGLSDDLFLDADRKLMTSADAGRRLAIGRKALPGAIKTITSCHLVGSRLVTWDVISKNDQAAASIRAETDGTTTDRHAFLLSQALYLSLRGPWPASEAQDTRMLAKILTMGAEQRALSSKPTDLDAYFAERDPYFNPCAPSGGTKVPNSIAQWKKENFRCTSPNDSGLSFYSIGGSGEATSYAALRDLLAYAIAEAFPTEQLTSTEATSDLWHLLTTTTAWTSQAGSRQKMGLYLATGNDPTYFSDAIIKPRSTPAAPEANGLALTGATSYAIDTASVSYPLVDPKYLEKLPATNLTLSVTDNAPTSTLNEQIYKMRFHNPFGFPTTATATAPAKPSFGLTLFSVFISQPPVPALSFQPAVLLPSTTFAIPSVGDALTQSSEAPWPNTRFMYQSSTQLTFALSASHDSPYSNTETENTQVPVLFGPPKPSRSDKTPPLDDAPME